MTTFTFHADAESFIARITDAPDHETYLNLIDQLKSRYVTTARNLEMMAESNERWAKEAKAKKQAVEQFVSAYIEFGTEASPALLDLTEAFDIEMTTEYSVSVTMTYNMTVTAPRGTDSDTIERELRWDGQPSFYTDFDGFELSGGDDIAADFDITID